MTVSTITVNYHSEAYLPGLQASLNEQAHITQRIIVDNGSSSELSDLVDDFTIIESPGNQGFAAAVNQAVSFCENRWMLLLNPDVVLHEACVDRLLNGAIEHSSPIVGPRFYLDDNCQFKLPPALGDCAWQRYAQSVATNSILDRKILDFTWVMRHERFWNTTHPFFEPFLSGSCLLIDKDTLCKDGKLFDEDYFLYYEDTELCIRALKSGHHPLCIPDATAIHYYDQSPDPDTPKTELMQRAQSIFYSQHYQQITDPRHIATAINGEWHDIEETDLGSVSEPPRFSSHLTDNSSRTYLELSLNQNFIPFVQADFDSDTLAISDDIWNRLRPGTYFARQRCQDLGTLKTWRWVKE